MNALSPWLINFSNSLNSPDNQPVFEKTADGYTFSAYVLHDSFWIVATFPKGCRIAFRAAYSPNDRLNITGTTEKEGQINFQISSIIGEYSVSIGLPSGEQPVLHYSTTLKPSVPLLFPYWPRDIMPLGTIGSETLAEGEIKVSQAGTRSGQLYFTLTNPNDGAVLYLQNLTSLANYNQQTETSAGDTVGGDWPEMGFALPPTKKSKALKAGKNYVLSDALIAFDTEVPGDESAVVKQYLNLLANVYLQMPKPDTIYRQWPDTLRKGLADLLDSPGCWSQVGDNHYFNAYFSDHNTPPEIMVQLAVLLPLLDYVEWSGEELAVIKKIKDGLPAFYDDKLKTIMRWHPKAADKLKGEEEQKQPLTMDSWYLHHPLLNLSRLALKGDKAAEELFLDSLGFAIKVAHHFNYDWPVFYKMDTLEVLKAETQPGKGGEKDVPGLYAHVMLQAYELTGEKGYLEEAEIAALKLEGLGFDVFYQANNTAFSAGAMLRLCKITKKEVYKELSYLCLASVFKNVRLWDCNYGFGKNFPSFFALFPLKDAPYTAAYEEQEVFCAFHDYLRHAEGEDILPSVRLLMSEYIRFLVERAMYYYPPMLPKNLLSEEVKSGAVDPDSWIALEDMHDGWERCGEVGQEVYGAGNAFGILPRHYMRVPGEDFMIYTDYPTYGFSAAKSKPATFSLAGDGRLNCRMMLVKTGMAKLPEFTVKIDKSKDELKGKAVKGGNLEFNLKGNAGIYINWKR